MRVKEESMLLYLSMPSYLLGLKCVRVAVPINHLSFSPSPDDRLGWIDTCFLSSIARLHRIHRIPIIGGPSGQGLIIVEGVYLAKVSDR